MSVRQRVYPTPAQVPMLKRHCSDSRFVWNLGLEQQNLWRPHRTQRISWASQARELTEARAAFPWLADGSAEIQHAALRDLDRAFRNWWAKPGHFGRPTWRRAGVHEAFYIKSYRVEQLGERWGQITVPKVGMVRFRVTRSWATIEAAVSARVTLDRAGRWHVSFISPPPPFERTTTGAVVGIDLGIAASVTTSDGAHLRLPPLLSPGEAQRKRRLQRQISRQVKGSNRRCRTKAAIGSLAAREADRRKDWIEKATTDLARDHDFIVIEDLRVANMVRQGRGKRGLNRSIHNQAWSLFRTRLTDKATLAIAPCELIAVNPAHTSQRCSCCAHVAAGSRESQSRFRCVGCGHTGNADVNAAQNILAAGLAVTGRGGTPHAQAQRPGEASIEKKVNTATAREGGEG